MSLVTIQMERKLCLLPRLKLRSRFFIDVNKRISLAWIIFFRCISDLWISHFETPISYPQQPARHFIFELSLGLKMVLINGHHIVSYQVINYVPILWHLQNWIKEKRSSSQTSALKFLFHACKFLTTAAWLAQLVESQSAVREVEGSSPRPDQHSGS